MQLTSVVPERFIKTYLFLGMVSQSVCKNTGISECSALPESTKQRKYHTCSEPTHPSDQQKASYWKHEICTNTICITICSQSFIDKFKAKGYSYEILQVSCYIFRYQRSHMR